MITREEYVAKFLANDEQKNKKVFDTTKEKEKIFADVVIKKITDLIEKLDTRRFYILDMVESRILSHSELFDEELAKLRQKYDFLEFVVISHYHYSSNTKVSWHLKEERKEINHDN